MFNPFAEVANAETKVALVTGGSRGIGAAIGIRAMYRKCQSSSFASS
jgi:hypothetical protein